MSLVEELLAIVPATLVFDPDAHNRYTVDRSTWASEAGRPLAIARPASTAEVEALVPWARRQHVALVPRGAGSGVSGGANASARCVVVSFELMAQIIDIDPVSMLAVVQPGVMNVDLKNAAREFGLWYPPDPASFEFSTIGGNVATNAGGLCCVRYGVTGNYVLALEAVLGDGRRLRTGSPARKNVAGYDLAKLLVGSEGTLGLMRLGFSTQVMRQVRARYSGVHASARS
jgi:glycolate oxidase